MTLTLATADISELDRLIAIHQSAFPDARSVEPRRRNFLGNPRGDFDRLFVARRDGEAVGHAFLFALSGSFGGALVPVGGIASVGVAPEARGTGVARALIDHLHARSAEEGHALTMLYAFRQGFYARMGYVQAPSHRVLSVAPRAFAAFDRRGHTLRTATGEDLPRLRELHALEASRHTGWIVRSEPSWLRLLSDERNVALVVVRNDVTRTVRGALFTTLQQLEPHARTVLRVDEMLAEDDDARAALYAHLHAQRDQVAEVSLSLPDGDPLELALVDADAHRSGTDDLEHPLGIIAGGPMLRLHDPARALAARGYLPDADAAAAATDAPFVLDVAGRKLALRVERGGRAAVGETEAPADLRLDARALTAMAFGGWRASLLQRLGWAHPLSPHAVARADLLFSLAPFFARDPF